MLSAPSSGDVCNMTVDSMAALLYSRQSLATPAREPGCRDWVSTLWLSVDTELARDGRLAVNDGAGD